MRLSWAGRVTTGALGTDFMAARTANRVLQATGSPGLDRRRAIAALWERISEARGQLGDTGRLVLLIVSEDSEGAAISGVGLDQLFAIHHGCLAESWVKPPHPLLGAPGLPEARPGALTVEAAPPYLVAVGSDGSTVVDPRGHRPVDLLPLCGVTS
ncbi:MAG: hypothetical protein KC912_12235 [Proteobacteria bacterium]|nr:hypothetical protein [Pseudomonadota bacterium]